MLNQYRYHLGQFQTEFAVFQLTGTDTFSFLQSQSTLDLHKLPIGKFHLATFLDPQGRVETYGWLLHRSNDYLFLVPKSLSGATGERLNRFLVSEDVEIIHLSNEVWNFSLGPEVKSNPKDDQFEGKLFEEKALLGKNKLSNAPTIKSDEIDDWRSLTGWPSFSGDDFKNEILNNLRLYDLALMPNKGCYPGQETVSKIATRRGAAFSPVLLEIPKSLPAGEITNFNKKIGALISCHEWQGKTYATANLLRDFRVEGMKVIFTIQGQETSGIVRYYPIISGNNCDKAEELFYQASDFFKNDDNDAAEKCLRLAIAIDPTHADSYESLGVILGRLERFQEAVEVMEQLAKIDKTSVLAHTNMSLFLMRLGKIDEAEEQKSLATVKSFQKFGEEAQVKELIQQEEEAKLAEWIQRESMFLQVLEIDEDDTLANYGIGSIAIEKSEWERARKHLEKVIQADPKYSVAYLALGKAYQGLSLKEEARDIWKKGLLVAASKGDLMPANQMQSELERL